MPKKLYLWAAICWTSIIALLCLVSFNQIPDVGIKVQDADKYVHAAFHFGFTILWYLYLRMIFPNVNDVRVLLLALLLSIIYGILIEFAQEFFTETRQADAVDVLANLTGATLGILMLAAFSKKGGNRRFNK